MMKWEWKNFRADLWAGLTVATLLIPQSMAYAQLAGLPPHYGLYASLVPVIVGGLLGSCPQLSTGPVAMSSLLVFTVLFDSHLAIWGSPLYLQLAILLAFLAGLIRVLIGLLQLTRIVNFVSHPVIVGFTNAGALIIGLSQLNKLLGLHEYHSGFFLLDTLGMFGDLRNCHVMTLLLGLSALVLMVVLRRMRPHWPGVLLAVGLTTLISWAIGFESRWHGEVIGQVPRGLPPLTMPSFQWAYIEKLLPGAAVIAMVGFMEVVAVSKAISVRTRQRLDFRREIFAQGMANIAGSFTGSFPVSGSFSRSALNLYAGARTPLASVITGIVVGVALLCFTPLLYHLPQSVLSATILVAVGSLIDFKALHLIGRVSWQDGLAGWITFVAALLLTPKIIVALLIGAVFSICCFFYHTMRPHVALLARHPDGTFRDAKHHNLPIDENVLILRFEGRLYFANIGHFEESIVKVLARFPRARAILIVADGINDIDASGIEKLRDMVRRFEENNLRIGFSELKWKVAEALAQAGLDRQIGSENIFRTTDAGFSSLSINRVPRVEEGKKKGLGYWAFEI